MESDALVVSIAGAGPLQTHIDIGQMTGVHSER